MWKKLTILSLFICLVSCKKDQKEGEDSTAIERTKEFKNEHNARTSLDYTGTYSGDLPCADCSSIRFKIDINENNTFHAKYIYVDKSNEVFEDKGYYKWLEEGNVITLKSKDSSNEYQFKIEENSLLMLSQDGKEIESALKEKYYLKKS